MESDDVFVCELCCLPIEIDQPQIRIGADVVVKQAANDYRSLTDNRVMVLAVFHSECVRATMCREDCDSLPYINEARLLINETETLPAAKDEEKCRFIILKGGLAE